MTAKALSPEEMEEERKFFSANGPFGMHARRLFAHISALEAENAALLAILRDAVMAMNHACDTLNDMDAVNPEEDAPAMAAVERVTEAMKRIDVGAHLGAALLERHEKEKAALRAFAEGFCLTAEGAVHHHETKGQGGQQVSYHDHFAAVPPSVVGQLRWWAREGRTALEGKVPGLLVRARNEGIEKAGQWLVAKGYVRAETVKHLERLKEPEQ